MEHPSEWYDITFQMIMINYYIQTINGYQYDNGSPENHYYKKLEKPIYKEYYIENYKFNINHKYLIVLWDIEKIEKTNQNKYPSNIKLLIKYLDDHKDNIKIFPSPRIIKLLNEVIDNQNNTISILNQYYNTN